MDEVIGRLRRYVDNLQQLERKPFYLLVDEQFHALQWSGNAAHYGFANIQRGDDLSDKLLFLVGLEEHHEIASKLPHLDIGNGISAQVHTVRLKNAWGLAFIDASEQHAVQLRYQQLAHELALAKEKQEKLFAKLQEAHQQLEMKNRALDEANELKTRFIGRMSHEFRTPLSSIIGFAELAKEDRDDPTRLQADVSAITRGAQYLLNLVDNLLDQAVMENQALVMRPIACDVHELVASLEELFQPSARQRGLSLAWWVGPDLPPRVWLDEMRLRQVLVNLISNAIKYTTEGGITISIDWENDQLSIEVEDTGRGIRADELESLFQPYNQGKDRNKSHKGAGLGLSISREIARHMGGDLQLRSEPGKGTRALCVLPAGARLEKESRGNALSGQRLLLLEHDQDVQNLLELYLLGADCQVEKAQDVGEAMLRLTQTPPDLLLVGLRGNDSDRQTPHQLREAGYKGQLIAVGTREDRANYRRILELGYDDLVTKPFKRTALLQDLGAFMQLAGKST